jgi:hypothetical protein
MALSFAADIKPIFQQYQERMMWRFDLTDYKAVSENAKLIQSLINPSTDNSGEVQPPQMPPANFPPLSGDFLTTYNEWVSAGCPA